MTAVQRFRPSLERDPLWAHVRRCLVRAKNNPANAPKKAKPATPTNIRCLIGDLSTPEQWAVWISWLTASRIGDWPHAATTLYRDMVVVSYPNGQKSDPYGLRQIKKWIPRSVEDTPAGWEAGARASVTSVQKYIAKMAPGLTGHSIRRGAMQWLQHKGFTVADVCIISGHVPTGDENAKMRTNWRRQGVGAYLETDARILRVTVAKCGAMATALRTAIKPLPRTLAQPATATLQ
jgi:hypothetical protein